MQVNFFNQQIHSINTRLTNKNTNWDALGELITQKMNLRARLKTLLLIELNSTMEEFIKMIQKVAIAAIPEHRSSVTSAPLIPEGCDY